MKAVTESIFYWVAVNSASCQLIKVRVMVRIMVRVRLALGWVDLGTSWLQAFLLYVHYITLHYIEVNCCSLMYSVKLLNRCTRFEISHNQLGTLWAWKKHLWKMMYRLLRLCVCNSMLVFCFNMFLFFLILCSDIKLMCRMQMSVGQRSFGVCSVKCRR